MSQSPKRSGALLVVGGAALLAAAAVIVVMLLNDGDAAPPRPVAVSSPSPSPSAAPMPQMTPFDLKLRAVGVQEMGNGGLYRRPSGNRRKGAAKHARQAVAELTRYLDAALIDPATRFTNAPVNRLLTGGAEQVIRRPGRRALGVGAPEVLGGRTGKASARAIVLYDGKRAHAVTVTYRARVNVIVPGATKPEPLRQRGVMVFVPTKNGWRADMVDVSTQLPERPTQEGPAGPEPSAPPAEVAS